ncbi:MAG: hypothetical protein KJO21_10675 [Verrucomicrobiae bacterium]|nr:hypothetical protein [Verrucomicrobiae bacterium]NNJ42748.1 hypothetical protein [Akkermansiaceae bacterium]
MQEISKTGRTIVVIAVLIILAIISAVALSYLQSKNNPSHGELETWTPSDSLHPVTIHQPDLMPMVDSGKKDREGKAVMIRCNNCHDTKEPNTLTEKASDLNDFHQHMTFRHNSLKCASCHHPDDYESLRLADGSSVTFSNVMDLCAQCHGPQYRDYNNGSHGGMNGYWDLSRGPRTRNNCVDCHDSHAPAYPKVMPVFPPKTRVGTQGAGGHQH